MLITDREREKESKKVKEKDNSYFKGRNLMLFYYSFKGVGLIPNKTSAYENVPISASPELLGKLKYNQ